MTSESFLLADLGAFSSEGLHFFPFIAILWRFMHTAFVCEHVVVNGRCPQHCATPFRGVSWLFRSRQRQGQRPLPLVVGPASADRRL
jgi:hypothetical protein